MLLAVAVLLPGCASDDSGISTPPAAQQQAGALAVGMKQEQVFALYGKPDNRRLEAGGETWVYNLSKGETFIPWNLGHQPRLRIVDFDLGGKVKGWNSGK